MINLLNILKSSNTPEEVVVSILRKLTKSTISTIGLEGGEVLALKFDSVSMKYYIMDNSIILYCDIKITTIEFNNPLFAITKDVFEYLYHMFHYKYQDKNKIIYCVKLLDNLDKWTHDYATAYNFIKKRLLLGDEITFFYNTYVLGADKYLSSMKAKIEDKIKYIEWLKSVNKWKPEYMHYTRSNKSGLWGMKTENVNDPYWHEYTDAERRALSTAVIDIGNMCLNMDSIPIDVVEGLNKLYYDDKTEHKIIHNSAYWLAWNDKFGIDWVKEMIYRLPKNKLPEIRDYKGDIAPPDIAILTYYRDSLKVWENRIRNYIKDDLAFYAKHNKLLHRLFKDLEVDTDLQRGGKAGLWDFNKFVKESMNVRPRFKKGDIILFNRPYLSDPSEKLWIGKITAVGYTNNMESVEYLVKLARDYNPAYTNARGDYYVDEDRVDVVINPKDAKSIEEFCSDYPEYIEELFVFFTDEEKKKYNYLLRSKRGGLLGLKTEAYGKDTQLYKIIKKDINSMIKKAKTGEFDKEFSYVYFDNMGINVEIDRKSMLFRIIALCVHYYEDYGNVLWDKLPYDFEFVELQDFDTVDVKIKKQKQIKEEMEDTFAEILIDKMTLEIAKYPEQYDLYYNLANEYGVEFLFDRTPEWIKRGRKGGLWNFKTSAQ